MDIGSIMHEMNEGFAQEDPQVGYNNLCRLIIDRYSTDIFIHSWSIDSKKHIEGVYSPVKSFYEAQKTFPTNLLSLQSMEI